MYIVSYLLANGKHNIEPNIACNDYRNDLLSIPVTTGEQTACVVIISPRVSCEDHADCCSGCPTAESVVNSDSLLLVYLVEYISRALFCACRLLQRNTKGFKGQFHVGLQAHLRKSDIYNAVQYGKNTQ